MGGRGGVSLAGRGGLAALGPYFVIETHDPGDPLAAPWRPLAELIGSPDALRERAHQVRGALARAGGLDPEQVELRAATSVAQLGLSARLIAPAFGLAVLERRGLGFDAGQARWVPGDGSMFPLSLPAAARPVAELPDAEDLSLAIEGRWLDGPIQDLVTGFAGLSVSGQILWGNVASAINGAAAMVSRSQPVLRARAIALAEALLATPNLAGRHSGVPAGPGFRRRSCCLIYRAAPDGGGGYCGDCVLAARQPGPPPSGLTQ
ncbi:MAG TPA: (2Fe-2S)-binding protein [Streptosporangiaceae bacterium]